MTGKERSERCGRKEIETANVKQKKKILINYKMKNNVVKNLKQFLLIIHTNTCCMPDIMFQCQRAFPSCMLIGRCLCIAYSHTISRRCLAYFFLFLPLHTFSLVEMRFSLHDCVITFGSMTCLYISFRDLMSFIH